MHQPGKQLFAWIDNSAAQSLQYTEEIIYVSAPHELKPATLDQQASPKVHPPLAPGGGKGGSIFLGVAGRPTRATETSLLFSNLTGWCTKCFQANMLLANKLASISINHFHALQNLLFNSPIDLTHPLQAVKKQWNTTFKPGQCLLEVLER